MTSCLQALHLLDGALSEEELRKIREVLERDKELNSEQQAKLDVIKAEIEHLEQGSKSSQYSKDESHTCYLCGRSCGWIFDRAEECLDCLRKVCKYCRQNYTSGLGLLSPVQLQSSPNRKREGEIWSCSLCYKLKEYKAISGEWLKGRTIGRQHSSKEINMNDLKTLNNNSNKSENTTNSTPNSSPRKSNSVTPDKSLHMDIKLDSRVSIENSVSAPQTSNRGSDRKEDIDPHQPSTSSNKDSFDMSQLSPIRLLDFLKLSNTQVNSPLLSKSSSVVEAAESRSSTKLGSQHELSFRDDDEDSDSKVHVQLSKSTAHSQENKINVSKPVVDAITIHESYRREYTGQGLEPHEVSSLTFKMSGAAPRAESSSSKYQSSSSAAHHMSMTSDGNVKMTTTAAAAKESQSAINSFSVPSSPPLSMPGVPRDQAETEAVVRSSLTRKLSPQSPLPSSTKQNSIKLLSSSNVLPQQSHQTFQSQQENSVQKENSQRPAKATTTGINPPQDVQYGLNGAPGINGTNVNYTAEKNNSRIQAKMEKSDSLDDYIDNIAQEEIERQQTRKQIDPTTLRDRDSQLENHLQTSYDPKSGRLSLKISSPTTTVEQHQYNYNHDDINPFKSVSEVVSRYENGSVNGSPLDRQMPSSSSPSIKERVQKIVKDVKDESEQSHYPNLVVRPISKEFRAYYQKPSVPAIENILYKNHNGVGSSSGDEKEAELIENRVSKISDKDQNNDSSEDDEEEEEEKEHFDFFYGGSNVLLYPISKETEEVAATIYDEKTADDSSNFSTTFDKPLAAVGQNLNNLDMSNRLLSDGELYSIASGLTEDQSIRGFPIESLKMELLTSDYDIDQKSTSEKTRDKDLSNQSVSRHVRTDKTLVDSRMPIKEVQSYHFDHPIPQKLERFHSIENSFENFEPLIYDKHVHDGSKEASRREEDKIIENENKKTLKDDYKKLSVSNDFEEVLKPLEPNSKIKNSSRDPNETRTWTIPANREDQLRSRSGFNGCKLENEDEESNEVRLIAVEHVEKNFSTSAKPSCTSGIQMRPEFKESNVIQSCNFNDSRDKNSVNVDSIAKNERDIVISMLQENNSAALMERSLDAPELPPQKQLVSKQQMMDGQFLDKKHPVALQIEKDKLGQQHQKEKHEQQEQVLVDQHKEKLIEQKRQELLEQKRQDQLSEEQKQLLAKQTEQELLERQHQEQLAEQQKQKMIEQKRQELLEQKRHEQLTEQQKQKMIEEHRQELLEQRRQELLEQQRQELLEQQRQELLEQQRQELLEQQRQELLEQQRQELLEQQRQELLEQQRQELLEQKRQEMLEHQHQEQLAEKQRQELLAKQQHQKQLAEKQSQELLAKQQHQEQLAEKQHQELLAEQQLQLIAEQKKKNQIEQQHQQLLAKQIEQELLEQQREEELVEQRKQNLIEQQRQEQLAEQHKLKLIEEQRQELLEQQRQEKLAEPQRQEKLAEQQRQEKLAEQQKQQLLAKEQKLELIKEQHQEQLAEKQELIEQQHEEPAVQQKPIKEELVEERKQQLLAPLIELENQEQGAQAKRIIPEEQRQRKLVSEQEKEAPTTEKHQQDIQPNMEVQEENVEELLAKLEEESEKLVEKHKADREELQAQQQERLDVYFEELTKYYKENESDIGDFSSFVDDEQLAAMVEKAQNEELEELLQQQQAELEELENMRSVLVEHLNKEKSLENTFLQNNEIADHQKDEKVKNNGKNLEFEGGEAVDIGRSGQGLIGNENILISESSQSFADVGRKADDDEEIGSITESVLQPGDDEVKETSGENQFEVYQFKYNREEEEEDNDDMMAVPYSDSYQNVEKLAEQPGRDTLFGVKDTDRDLEESTADGSPVEEEVLKTPETAEIGYREVPIYSKVDKKRNVKEDQEQVEKDESSESKSGKIQNFLDSVEDFDEISKTTTTFGSEVSTTTTTLYKKENDAEVDCSEPVASENSHQLAPFTDSSLSLTNNYFLASAGGSLLDDIDSDFAKIKLAQKIAEDSEKTEEEKEDKSRVKQATVSKSSEALDDEVFAHESELSMSDAMTTIIENQQEADDAVDSGAGQQVSDAPSRETTIKSLASTTTDSSEDVDMRSGLHHMERLYSSKMALAGEVHFGLVYDNRVKTLEIHVHQCKDIAGIGQGRTNPYVKTYLMPDKTRKGKRKTGLRRNTENPVFNEILKYKIAKSDLTSRILSLTVWHNVPFGRNVFLGEVVQPLDGVDLDDADGHWYPLHQVVETHRWKSILELNHESKLELSLSYATAPRSSGDNQNHDHHAASTTGDLHAKIIQAKSLTSFREDGSCSPYVKCLLQTPAHGSMKAKSETVKETRNPMWNQEFTFANITLEQMKTSKLEITIWSKESLLAEEFLGGVKLFLGDDVTNPEVELWRNVTENPDRSFQTILPLRSTMEDDLLD